MRTGVRSDWTGAILVCGKCSRRTGDRPRLAKVLRGAVGGGKGRHAETGVVETKCLGICPKRGVVVIDTAQLGTWRVIEPGATASEVLERLGRDQA